MNHLDGHEDSGKPAPAPKTQRDASCGATGARAATIAERDHGRGRDLADAAEYATRTGDANAGEGSRLGREGRDRRVQQVAAPRLQEVKA